MPRTQMPGRIPVDHCLRLVQPVAAFDGAAHPLFAVHLQQPSFCQQGHVAVYGGLREVGQASAQLGSRGGPPADAATRPAR
jgi:hypothetical protein